MSTSAYSANTPGRHCAGSPRRRRSQLLPSKRATSLPRQAAPPPFLLPCFWRWKGSAASAVCVPFAISAAYWPATASQRHALTASCARLPCSRHATAAVSWPAGHGRSCHLAVEDSTGQEQRISDRPQTAGIPPVAAHSGLLHSTSTQQEQPSHRRQGPGVIFAPWPSAARHPPAAGRARAPGAGPGRRRAPAGRCRSAAAPAQSGTAC